MALVNLGFAGLSAFGSYKSFQGAARTPEGQKIIGWAKSVAKGTGSTANSYGIKIDSIKFSKTVQNHKGRPYQNSKLLINEIIESKPPVPDPRGTNALSWTVEGSFNGSEGYYELIIDPASNTVWHFVFKSR